MPVISQFFTGAKQLQIELIEPVVFFRVDSTDTSTHVVRGEVSVVLTKAMPILVTLKLIGKSTILWPEGIQGGKSIFEKTIHEQELILHSDSRSGLVKWPFQFLVSNTLPETIEDDRGKVFYYLISIMNRNGMTSSPLRARRDLLLLRTPHWSENPPPDKALEEKLEECDTSIRLEKDACSSGTHLPVILTILPQVKHLFLKSIRVTLNEKRVYIMNSKIRRVLSQDTNVDLVEASGLFDPPLDIQPALTGSAEIPLNDWPVQHRLLLMMPNCYHVNHSSSYSDIHITHTLKVDIQLSHHTVKKNIQFKTPITLLDCRLRDDYDVLPTYQESLLPIENQPEAFICPRFLLYKKKKNPRNNLEEKPPPYNIKD